MDACYYCGPGAPGPHNGPAGHLAIAASLILGKAVDMPTTPTAWVVTLTWPSYAWIGPDYRTTRKVLATSRADAIRLARIAAGAPSIARAINVRKGN